jgi:hypothetical protein
MPVPYIILYPIIVVFLQKRKHPFSDALKIYFIEFKTKGGGKPPPKNRIIKCRR